MSEATAQTIGMILAVPAFGALLGGPAIAVLVGMKRWWLGLLIFYAWLPLFVWAAN